MKINNILYVISVADNILYYELNSDNDELKPVLSKNINYDNYNYTISYGIDLKLDNYKYLQSDLPITSFAQARHIIIKTLLLDVLKNNLYLEEYILARHITTFKTGGKIEFMVFPSNYEELKAILKLAKNFPLPMFIVGKGSNLLIRDEGYNGIMISLDNMCNYMHQKNDTVTVGSSVTLKDLSNFCITNSLSGLEFASGIPGSVGGAICMNAGAYNGEMKDVVISCTVVNNEHDIITLNNEELKFAYRNSIIKEKKYIVLSTTIKLSLSSKETIMATTNDLNNKRVSKQPLEYPSAGSTFKRPDGYFAAKLISDANLAGYSIGGAMVSSKHTGFLINYNNATSTDIINLINYVQKVVYDKFNVKLEKEVIIL